MNKEIKETAKRYQLDPSLLNGVMMASSGGNNQVVSTNGGKGIMGLQQRTARQLGVTDYADDSANLDAGASYLSTLIKRYKGDENKALRAYNQSEGFVETVREYQVEMEEEETESTKQDAGDSSVPSVGFLGKLFVFVICIMLCIASFNTLLKAFNVDVGKEVEKAVNQALKVVDAVT